MTPASIRTITPAIDVYVRLAPYPILSDIIRERMRQELFMLDSIDPDQFEREIEELSVASQLREGMADPYAEENAHSWRLRKERTREFHTDAYFADNIGIARLDTLIKEVLGNQSGEQDSSTILNFNPEIAPWEMLFHQGKRYEGLMPEGTEDIRHHLEEIKVVLIKRLMSEHLPFIGVAKRILTIGDLRRIYMSLIGTGKIGGKAASMILAWRSLKAVDETFGPGVIGIPDSFFVGTDVIYEFFLMNKLEDYMNQKYLPISEIRTRHPQIIEDFRAAALPDYIVTQIREVLESLGNSPLVVRSSGLLEDNFGYSFAGKYSSFFCTNQGTPEENLACVLDAIKRIYASALNPDAMMYRKNHDLIDYDERMAVIIQRATGRFHGHFHFPDIAGLAFSRNPFCWTDEIKPGDGFLRVVTGLGTRAVERVTQDYPRLIPLSHPQLRPEKTAEEIRQYSQRLLATVDGQEDELTTVTAEKAIPYDDEVLPLIASLDAGEELLPITPGQELGSDERFVLTFNGLTADQPFIDLMRAILRQLEKAYSGPVDIEFALERLEPEQQPTSSQNSLPSDSLINEYQLHILECRPLHKRIAKMCRIDLLSIDDNKKLFDTPSLLPSVQIGDLDYAIFVDPEAYYAIEDHDQRLELASLLTRLNEELPRGRFALIGPGRWGSTNDHLSVPVTYSNICNSKLLVELTPVYGLAPEIAYGTDFLEDLMEADITVLGIRPGTDGSYFNWEFFRDAPNELSKWLPDAADFSNLIRVVNLTDGEDQTMAVAIDDTKDRAIGYFQ